MPLPELDRRGGTYPLPGAGKEAWAWSLLKREKWSGLDPSLRQRERGTRPGVKLLLQPEEKNELGFLLEGVRRRGTSPFRS